MPVSRTGKGKSNSPYIVGDHWLAKRDGSDAWYRATYDKASRKETRASLATTDLAIAKQALLEFVRVNSDGAAKDPSLVLLYDVLDQYWEHHGRHIASSGAVAASIVYWKRYFPKSTVLTDLHPSRVLQFVDDMREEGHSDGYIARIITDGRSAVNRAKKYMVAKWVPSISKPSVSDAPPKGRPLSLEELARLIGVAPPHVQNTIAILTNTLCRPGAARDLTPAQVKWDEGLIDLNPPGRRQTDKRRPIVPMTESIRDTLRKIEQKAEADGQELKHYLSWGGKRLTSSAGAWQAMVKRAGFDIANENITPYSIRHTMGRELRRRRVASEDISVFMGHAPPGTSRTTDVYAPFEAGYLADAAIAVNDFANDVRAQVISLGYSPGFF